MLFDPEVTKQQPHADLKHIAAPGLFLVWRNTDYYVVALFLG